MISIENAKQVFEAYVSGYNGSNPKIALKIRHTYNKNIYESVLHHKQIRREYRRTKMDMWIFYLAFLFDFNFPASHQYVLDHHCVENNIDRIPCSNPDTAKKMRVIRDTALRYCRECAAR